MKIDLKRVMDVLYKRKMIIRDDFFKVKSILCFDDSTNGLIEQAKVETERKMLEKQRRNIELDIQEILSEEKKK